MKLSESGTENTQSADSHPLHRLDYFIEWGGRTWQTLMKYAFSNFLGTDLQGQQVLDIGTRYGKMASLFALLGAKVIGVDLSKECLSVAVREANKWSVRNRLVFVVGRGDLSLFKDNSFDVIFSKSVLVVVPNLPQFLDEVSTKLKPGGKVVFLENAKGPRWLHLLRGIRHGKWDYTKARYFTSSEIEVVSAFFDNVVIERRMFPPVVLMLGYKRDKQHVP